MDIPPDITDAFEREVNNLLSAMSEAYEVGDVDSLARIIASSSDLWYQTGRYAQVDRWLRLALAADPPPAPRLRAQLLELASSSALLHLAHPRSAERLGNEAVRTYVDEGLIDSALRVRGNLAITLRYLNRPAEAAEELEHVIANSSDAAHPELLALLELSDAYRALGHLDRAERLIETAWRLADERNVPNEMATVLAYASMLRLTSRHDEAARETVVRALRTNRDRRRDPHNWVDNLGTAGVVSVCLGDDKLARECLVTAVRTSVDIGYHLPVSEWMCALAVAESRAGDPRRSVRLMGAAAELRRRSGIALILSELGQQQAEAVDALRSILVAEDFDGLWREGRRAADLADSLLRLLS